MPCEQYGNLTICRTPGHTEKTDDSKVAWCFGCRKRRTFHWMVFFPEIPSYYDPHGYWQCEQTESEKWRNHSDVFPGCE